MAIDLDEAGVLQFCTPHGEVVTLELPRTLGGRSIGVAYVEMARDARAEQLRRALHRMWMSDYRLVVTILPPSSRDYSTL